MKRSVYNLPYTLLFYHIYAKLQNLFGTMLY